jgi:hypothetical protein
MLRYCNALGEGVSMWVQSAFHRNSEPARLFQASFTSRRRISESHFRLHALAVNPSLMLEYFSSPIFSTVIGIVHL